MADEGTTSAPPAAPLPAPAMAAAALAVFDGLLALGVLGLWIARRDDALALLQRTSGIFGLASFGAIGIGVWISLANRRRGRRMPGSGWAAGAIGAGLALLAVVVLVPMVAAFSLLIDSAR